LDNEEKLVKGCRAGEASAREMLYNQFSRQMMAVCYRYTGNMEDAHDVLHDGFIKAFTHFNFKGESSLSTWLTKVMMTTAVDFLRQRNRLEQLSLDDRLNDVEDTAYEESEVIALGTELTESELLRMVGNLPEGCRTVFNLYVFEGKTHKEIAQMLGIKQHSSTSQYSRAKYLLMKSIKEYMTHGK